MDGVNKIVHNAPRKVSGTGYVIIPSTQPREKYIKSCFKNQTINIITTDGEIILNCLVSKHIWNNLIFPTVVNERGSCVGWINIPYAEKVLIVSVLNKKDEFLEVDTENTFKFKRKVGENNVQITGDGRFGSLKIITEGEDIDQSEIDFRLINVAYQALFNLYVQGNLKFNIENNADFRIGNTITFIIRDDENAGKSAKIVYKLGEGFQLVDEFGNQITTKQGGIFLEVANGDKVYNVAKGSTGQPALLGNEVESLLEENNKLLKTFIETLDKAVESGSNIPTAPFKIIMPKLKLNVKNLQSKIKNIKAKNLNIT